jgi:glycosyltransferase involved in cell wall biosynthesis
MKTSEPSQVIDKGMSANVEPDISLVVPIFNQRNWLQGLFDSIQGQVDPPRFEVVFCDDGSSDGSLDVARSLAERYVVDARFVWQPDEGFRLSRSRNNGIRCAAGRIVVFSDGDTWLAPSYLRDHWQSHQTAGRLVCGSRYTKYVPELPPGCVWRQDGAAPVEGATQEPANQAKWLGSRWEWAGCFGGNFSVERERCLLFDENFRSWGSEDRDLAFRLIESGLKVSLLPQPNAIQWKLSGANWTDMSHDEVVAFLENKSYLASKYPNGELAPSVNLVRRCHLSADGQWSIGPTREDTATAEVFDEFCTWKRRRTPH